MRKDLQNGRCIVSIGSMTQAMRAQATLAQAAIRTEIVSTSNLGKGCAYGLSYDCRQGENVRHVLRRAGIRVRSFFGNRA